MDCETGEILKGGKRISRNFPNGGVRALSSGNGRNVSFLIFSNVYDGARVESAIKKKKLFRDKLHDDEQQRSDTPRLPPTPRASLRSRKVF